MVSETNSRPTLSGMVGHVTTDIPSINKAVERNCKQDKLAAFRETGINDGRIVAVRELARGVLSLRTLVTSSMLPREWWVDMERCGAMDLPGVFEEEGMAQQDASEG